MVHKVQQRAQIFICTAPARAHTHTCTHARAHTHMHAHTRTHMHVRTHTHMHAHTHTHVHTCTCTHSRMHTHAHTHTHHTNTHTCTRTHTPHPCIKGKRPPWPPSVLAGPQRHVGPGVTSSGRVRSQLSRLAPAQFSSRLELPLTFLSYRPLRSSYHK